MGIDWTRNNSSPSVVTATKPNTNQEFFSFSSRIPLNQNSPFPHNNMYSELFFCVNIKRFAKKHIWLHSLTYDYFVVVRSIRSSLIAVYPLMFSNTCFIQFWIDWNCCFVAYPLVSEILGGMRGNVCWRVNVSEKKECVLGTQSQQKQPRSPDDDGDQRPCFRHRWFKIKIIVYNNSASRLAACVCVQERKGRKETETEWEGAHTCVTFIIVQ